MRIPYFKLSRWPLFAGVVLLSLSGMGCVYRLDVQQGNLLEQQDIDAVKVGMTRSQVHFLLGTPVVDDPFDKDRWDYMYYFRPGKKRKVERRWVIVYFDDDTVREIRTDVPAG